MKKSGAKAYLVNTGWNGTGKRISIKDTRGIIDAILDGSIDKAKTKKLPIFDFEIPTALPGVDSAILDPRDTYKSASEWDVKAKDLAERKSTRRAGSIFRRPQVFVLLVGESGSAEVRFPIRISGSGNRPSAGGAIRNRFESSRSGNFRSTR